MRSSAAAPPRRPAPTSPARPPSSRPNPNPTHARACPPAVVSAVQEVCIQRGIQPPTIITESGRALASHHSVLVFDVLTTCAQEGMGVEEWRVRARAGRHHQLGRGAGREAPSKVLAFARTLRATPPPLLVHRS